MSAEIYKAIKEDQAAARKDRGADGKPREPVKVNALGVVISDIEAMAKARDKVEDRVVNDNYTIKVLKAAISTATGNIPNWEKAGRDTGPIHQEIAILEAYLPEAVDLAEVREAAREFAADDAVKHNPRAGMGIVLNRLKERYGVRYEKSWSDIVKGVIGV